jgi:hypothetical protein
MFLQPAFLCQGGLGGSKITGKDYDKNTGILQGTSGKAIICYF